MDIFLLDAFLNSINLLCTKLGFIVFCVNILSSLQVIDMALLVFNAVCPQMF